MADDNYDPDRLMTERPSGTPMATVRPRLSREDATKLVRKYNPDITRAAVEGEVDNIMRESGGNASNNTGDHGTSGGLYQHHLSRLAGLKSFAKEHGTDWTNPEIQIQYARMEKERDYPALLRAQQNATDRGAANEQFKRVFERPASVLWQHDASGQPVFGNDQYRYSDYAMDEAKRREGSDLFYMHPAEYLDLSPELEGKPFESPSGRSLMKSFQQGEPIQAVPTLNVDVDGPTATVTDQDGRHRALLAQQQGLEAMPVSISGLKGKDPKEIVGMTGKVMAHDFPRMNGYQPPAEQPKEPISLIGSAHAAEPARDAAGNPVDAASSNPFADLARPAAPAGANPFADLARPAEQPQQGGPPTPELANPGASEWAALKGAAKGVGDTMFGAQELLGKGMEAIGIPGGQTLTEDARQRMAAENRNIAPTQADHPTATGVGEFLGGMIAPGGIAGKVTTNALRAGALSGALSGLLAPGDPDNYWGSKALQAGAGTAAGLAGAGAGNVLSKMVAPNLREAVSKLMGEGVQLTPGQMAGGAAKRAEDALGSIPLLGSAIRAAQRRSIQTFNRAAINRSLEDIGQKLPAGLDSGHNAIAFAHDEFTKAYDQVIPRMRGAEDGQFRSDLLDVLNKARSENLPQQFQDQLRHLIGAEVVSRFNAGGGTITGTDAQKIGTQLDRLVKTMRISPDPYVQHLGRLVRDVDTALDDMMARQNPALQSAKDQIDAGYAKFKTVQRAATALGAHADGTFTPAQLNQAVKARDLSKDKAAFARGDALLQDLAAAARSVLPQTVPDSGTPERAMLMSLIGGTGYFEPHSAALLAGMAVPYTAPASKALNAAVNRLSQTPGPARNALASGFEAASRVGGPAAGAAAAQQMQGGPIQ